MIPIKFKWLEPYVASEEPNIKGEFRMRCPLHNDTEPSANVNFEKGVWRCHAGCGGGAIGGLRAAIKARKEEETAIGEADYDPFAGNADGVVVDIERARAKKNGSAESEHLTEARVRSWHNHLKADKAKLAVLIEERGLTEATIDAHMIGYDAARKRYVLPVRDENGSLVNLRRYKPDAASSEKMRNALGHGSPPRLYPIANLTHDQIIVCEGEMDALLTTQHGFPAVTGTHGASTWLDSWAKSFVEKQVFVIYDCDKEGRIGAKKATRSLARHAASVTVVTLPGDKEHYDLTDWWLGGHTAEELQELMASATSASEATVEPEAMPVPVQVIGSMDSRTNGKPLAMQVTITGRRNPTYSVPKIAQMSCTMDAGPKCKVCPMAVEWEGEHQVTILPNEVNTIARFIDANEDRKLDLLRKTIGAVKCNRLSWEPVENQTVEEVFVTSSIDRRSHEESDYTQRRIYNVGSHDTKTNTTAKVVGTTVPNPKDSRNEFLSWHLEEAVTSIDHFTMTPERYEKLRQFQPEPGQTPLAKCWDIASDLSASVTKIYGRERMQIAMDLVWHSVLHFPLDGKVISRGWLEFIVVGDTRTGKSETAIRLADHYGLGHIIGCEGATFAGLVGGVKQLGEAWTVSWGEVTLNDRRLVVLDEASGLSQDLIGQLSDIRSRGMAQLTKIESQQTRARTRMIWISNPRKSKFVDEKKVDGIDIIEDLIGNPEDIARFDFAMSVKADDVPTERINSPMHDDREPKYSSDACHELILWAWSRKPDQVEWKDRAYTLVYEGAEWLGQRYIEQPPLIQRSNVREKIARVAVALAARTFSTDERGERVLVEEQHVKDAINFINKLYSYENFGYMRVSKRAARNKAIAKQNRLPIKKWLLENPRLLEFLMDRRGSFRSQDLEEMAHMQRDEVNEVLGKLSDAKMVSKSKSQIVVEPELSDLLREMEK